MNYDAPNNDEIEISLFGDGFGESILIHLGDDIWLVVDSFIHSETGRPIVFDYFENIRKDLKYIKYIVVSHWHDDHIKGISEIFKNAIDSKIIISSALKHKDFITLVKSTEPIEFSTKTCLYFKDKTGLTEFSEILNILKTRTKDNRKYALADILLYKDKVNNFDISIHSLSPSHNEFEDALKDILSLIPKENDYKLKIPSNREINGTSIVLLIMINDTGILLGADLENKNDECYGWKNVLKTNALKDKTITFFKIPHHGSKTGYSEDLWNYCIDKDNYSFLTSFVNGKNKIPSNKEINDLLKKSQKLYITSDPQQRIKQIKRKPSIQKMVNMNVKNIIQSNGEFGHIRVRFKPYNLDDIKIRLYGKAKKYQVMLH